MKDREKTVKVIRSGREERMTRADYVRELLAELPPRPRTGHKGSFGRVQLACGSPTYTGAALLSAEGALRMGCGFVFLYAPHAVAEPMRARLPEVIIREILPMSAHAAEGFAAMRADEDARGAVLVGCGLGQVDGEGKPVDAAAFARALDGYLSVSGAPLVLDADALNLAAHAFGVGDLTVAARLRRARRPVVITPHPAEFSRISGLSMEEIAADRVGVALRFAEESGAVVLLKGAGTVIATPTGDAGVNPTGSTALSKGGSGDVLAGMLVSLLAQGMSPYAAARLAAYLHGAAGEEESALYTERGVLPSELPRAAARVLCTLLSVKKEQKNE